MPPNYGWKAITGCSVARLSRPALSGKAARALSKKMMFVYILFSEKSSRYYVGQTADIAERLKRHNSGRVSSTKHGIPWKVVLQLIVLNRSEAMILESKIKKRGAKRFIDDHRGVA